MEEKSGKEQKERSLKRGRFLLLRVTALVAQTADEALWSQLDTPSVRKRDTKIDRKMERGIESIKKDKKRKHEIGHTMTVCCFLSRVNATLPDCIRSKRSL